MASVSNWAAVYEGAFLQPGQAHGWWTAAVRLAAAVAGLSGQRFGAPVRFRSVHAAPAPRTDGDDVVLRRRAGRPNATSTFATQVQTRARRRRQFQFRDGSRSDGIDEIDGARVARWLNPAAVAMPEGEVQAMAPPKPGVVVRDTPDDDLGTSIDPERLAKMRDENVVSVTEVKGTLKRRKPEKAD